MEKTFSEFQQSRQLMATKNFEDKYGIPDIISNHVMCYDGLFIEVDHNKEDSYHLLIDRDEYHSNSLESLEAILYTFAANNGYFKNCKQKYLSGLELKNAIEKIIDKAAQPFWIIVSKEFPEIKSNATAIVDFKDRLESIIKDWYLTNQI